MESLSAWLTERRKSGRHRRLPATDRPAPGRIADTDGRILYDFVSNDYLALTAHPRLIEASHAALDRYGTGAGAARLMSGDLAIHRQLEEEAARLTGKEAALLFGSGYLANAGIIPALVGRGDLVLTDRLDHASIYDGCRLAGARLLRFRHNDCDHLESQLRRHRGRNALVVVESVYSMDGDFAPLADLVDLKNQYGFVLMVDEAHAVGIYGEGGGGRVVEAGLSDGVDIVMGTFGKALGSYGAFAAADRILIEYLVNRARTFIFSTALPPAVIGASLAGIELVRATPELRADLAAKAKHFKETLAAHGITTASPSQIVPVIIGADEAALECAKGLRERGIYVTAVRPPTVPAGTARLRLSITRHQTDEALAEAAAAVAAVIGAITL